MKKINNNTKIITSIGSKNAPPKSQLSQGNLKTSLKEIQRLSQQIDTQIQKNQNKQQRQIYKQNHSDSQSQQQEEIGPEWPQKQKHNQDLNIENNVLEKAVQMTIHQYFGFDLQSWLYENDDTTFPRQMHNKESRFVDIQSYEEYRKTKQFNNHFKELVPKLQHLRILSLLSSQHNVQNEVKLQNQSDVLQLISNVIKIKKNLSKSQQQEVDYLYCNDPTTLQMIQKIQGIQQALQTKLNSLQDNINFKREAIEQLRTNQETIKDDIQLLQNRNNKLKKQIQSIQSYGRLTPSSQQDDQVQSIKKNNQYHSIQQDTIQSKQLQLDYHKEYQQLMHYYELYNPQTNLIQHSFPKNKTEVMMLLNKIQAKIQKLQMQKTLQALS